MKQVIRKICVFLMLVMAVSVLKPTSTYAATAKTSVSANDGKVGDTIAVNIQISSEDILGTYEIYIDYNESKLICPDGNDVQGGGGRVKIIGGADMTQSSSASYTINFEAKAAGTSKIEVSGSAYYFDEATGDVVEMVVEPSSTKVKIKSEKKASTDNTLSDLSLQTDSATGISKPVKLDPEFSPEITEYHASFTYDVNKVVVSATQADPKATVEISGTRIDLGDNTTKITVTAEDGSVKEYIIYSTKTTDLPNPTTSEDETSTEETTTKPEKADGNIYVEEMEKYIIIDIAGLELPEGFEESTYTYAEKTVNVARGISKNLVLMYLADDEEMTNGAFYIYDDKNDLFYKMCNIQTDKKLYTIIKTPDNLEIPEGFLEKKVKINGVNVDAWAIDGEDTFYLVYAMNWEGSKGLYVFDRSEGTMQRYISDAVNTETDEEDGEQGQNVVTDNGELESVYATMNELKKEYKTDRDLKWKIIVGIAIVCVILIILCIVLLSKLKDVEIIEEEDVETPQEPEIKLDMAQHANEMNIGVLAANVEEIVSEEEVEPEAEPLKEEAVEPEAEPLKEEAVEPEAEPLKEEAEEPTVEQTQQEVSDTGFKMPKEPEFVQPAEMKIVSPEVFEQIIGFNDIGFEEDDDDEFDIEFVEIDNDIE
ncbi:MAG: cadherin-like beta sandwich domain-containing protein [Lachnospiraceae bacterium]|nr:cadherin-like beta sandwich domain-containing protein [Lachnospiraceae bacterium]